MNMTEFVVLIRLFCTARVVRYYGAELPVRILGLAFDFPVNEDNSFTAFDQVLDRRLGTFWINADGELYRWRHDDGTEYIYGPHRKFGQISFPDWGTQVDGSWSFYYVDVRWSSEAPSVSFDPPDG